MKKILTISALCATMAYAGADVLPVEKRTFEQSKFMPDISLIVDASMVNRDVDADEAPHLEIPGVAHGLLGSHSDGGATHSSNNAQNGFNVNYAELVLSSSVDPFLSMDGVFHFSEHGVEIEEVYFTSTAFGNGVRLRGGKFQSNFGYLNEQHQHSWNFADMPLVYESFLGMHGINEKGIQFQWVAPTSTYFMIGAEVLQGENEQMFGNKSIAYTESGSISESADAPSLYVAYAKTSFDVGETTLLAGVSYVKGATRLDHSSDDEEPHAFSGDSSLYGADLLVKHYFNSYSFLSFQSEYIARSMDGTYYDDINSSVEPYTYASESMTKEQAGLYSQLVYAHDKNWRVGVRYDSIIKNDVNSVSLEQALNKYSAMLEYHTSEFARFRLQYNRNNALYNEDGEQQKINTIMIQANISIGAHGAHSF